MLTRSRAATCLRLAPRIGLSLEDLEMRAEAVGSNIERDELALRLLAELSAARSPWRAASLRELLQRLRLFHEDAAVASRLRGGQGLIEVGKLAEAEAQLEEAARLDPSCAEAWHLLATARFLRGDDEASLEAARRALVLEPAHVETLAGMGRTLMRLKDFGAAASVFGAQRQVSPASLEALGEEWRAQTLRLVRSADSVFVPLAPFASAIVVTASVLLGVVGSGDTGAAGWQDSTAPWRVAEVQIEEVRTPSAVPGGADDFRRETRITRLTRTGAPLSELTQAAEQLTSSADRVELSGRLLDELGATEQPSRAADLTRLLWKTWFFHEDVTVAAALQVGSQLMDEGDLERAERSFSVAARLDPHYSEAWNRLATVHWLMGDLERSLVECDAVLDLEPRHFGALSGRGLVLMDLGRYSEAASAFREAQEVCPVSDNLQRDIAFAEAMQREAADPGP